MTLARPCTVVLHCMSQSHMPNLNPPSIVPMLSSSVVAAQNKPAALHKHPLNGPHHDAQPTPTTCLSLSQSIHPLTPVHPCSLLGCTCHSTRLPAQTCPGQCSNQQWCRMHQHHLQHHQQQRPQQHSTAQLSTNTATNCNPAGSTQHQQDATNRLHVALPHTACQPSSAQPACDLPHTHIPPSTDPKSPRQTHLCTRPCPC